MCRKRCLISGHRALSLKLTAAVAICTIYTQLGPSNFGMDKGQPIRPQLSQLGIAGGGGDIFFNDVALATAEHSGWTLRTQEAVQNHAQIKFQGTDVLL